MLENLTPEQQLRMHCLAMAVHCNEEVTGEMSFIIGDAERAYAFVMEGTKPVSEVAPIKDTMAKIADAVQPATDFPTMVSTPTSNVVEFPEPLPVSDDLYGDEPPRKERKPRGPNKVKAKGKGGRPKKVRTEVAKNTDAATVSEGEKDTPIANGAGEHIEAASVSEPQMAA
jgi:hypothetical protein